MTSAFDTTHTTNNADNKYAKLLTTDQTIYQTDKALGETPAPLSNFTAYYGVRLTLATVAGEYKTTITYTAIGEVVPEPIYPEVLAIVPNIASTKVPNGNGTGSNGPQFSIAGSNFGANPTVTIGGQPCTEITVNSAGTALTCSGPTSDLSAGDKAVVVTDTIGNKSSNKDKTVTYDATDYSTLQSLTNATCQNLPLRLTGSDPATIFRDARDSQLYYVARLAGNKCWMLDNLKYKPNGDTTGTVTPGFPATQVANTYTANYLTQDGTSTTTSPNQDAAKYIDPISQAYCYNNTNKSTYNITKCGLLYNYHTATAGTNIQANYSAADRNASGSICPANWRLPSGYDASGDFGVLDKAYLPGGTGSYHDLSNPDTQGLWQYSGAFAGVFSGDYFSSFYDQGIYGRLWSSSANSAIYGNVLYFNSSDVRPGTYNVKRFYGVGVRCVIDS
jgi:uncharacterized protein (TIGR02145 family)